MNEHRFEFIEHTADKGIVACGDTLVEALENVAYGMFSLMAELDKYEGVEERAIEAQGADDVSLLHAWLNELLFVFEVDRVLPVSFNIGSLENGALTATVAVHPFGPDIEWLGSGVKAITYHEMLVERLDVGYRVRAIVDV